MKISYKHLKDFLIKDPTIEDISETLFQLGHENEILNNEIIDIDFTPNRGDCLSLNGLARDLNFFYSKNSEIDIYKKPINVFDFKFINNAKNHCPHISFLLLEIEGKIDLYQDYLESFFTDLENKKNNFFSDLSNYLSYELGQPIHCYDMEKMSSTLTLEVKDINETFETVTGQKINLKGENLVFISNGNIINLAGIMGGNEVSCSTNTTKVLVECAYFLPEAIIGKSLEYGLLSDAAYKFERGVDPLNQENVLRRFISIVCEHASIKNMGLLSFNENNFEQKKLKVDDIKVTSILGHKINKEDFEKYLTSLGFIVEKDIVEVPSYRNDIENCNDIAEEIARLIGYDNISSCSIDIKRSALNEPDIENSLRTYLSKMGFNEVINQPFSKSKSNIKVDNPIDSNKPFIRDNLRDSLIENLIYNERRQKDSIKLFEVANIYDKKSGYVTEKKLGVLVTGRAGKDYKSFSKIMDQAYLHNIFLKCSLNVEMTKIIEVDRSIISTKNKSKIYMIELDLKLFNGIDFKEDETFLDFMSCNKYEPISEYPFISRDLSLMFRDRSILKDLENKILNFETDNLKETFVFDYFLNPKTRDIKLGFRFIFQSKVKTLTIEDIEPSMKKITDIAFSFDGVSIPGINNI